jgi:hypothetical protein
MKTMRSKLVGTVVRLGTCLGALLFASSAVADSTVTYSGYSCLYASALSDRAGLEEGAVFDREYTRCPLTRIASDVAGSIAGLYVRVQDNSPTQTITCYAVSCDGTGDVCSTGSTDSSGGTFTGKNSLHIGGVAAYSTGYAYIHCDLPVDGTQSVIYSYRGTD